MNVKRIEVPPSRLTDADFPALASGGGGPTATTTSSGSIAKRGGSGAAAALVDGGLKSPDIDPKGTWADQVEAGQTQQVRS